MSELHFTDEEIACLIKCPHNPCDECLIKSKCDLIDFWSLVGEDMLHNRKELARVTAERNNAIEANKAMLAKLKELGIDYIYIPKG